MTMRPHKQSLLRGGTVSVRQSHYRLGWDEGREREGCESLVLTNARELGIVSSERSMLEMISSVTSAKDEPELLARMKVAARQIGYDQVLFAIEMRLPGAAPVQHIASGFDPDYRTLYQERAFVGVDPAVTHCRTSPKPLIWSEHMYGNESREMMEEARSYGLGHGLSLPVHRGSKVVSMLSLARDRPFQSDAERAMVLAAGNVLAHCLHVTSENLILPNALAKHTPRLSPREKECFLLVALGKSNWDIGKLLHISEASVAFHVQNVLRKMRVSTRTQAVAIGVTLGMIN
jgi:DNA-binding CsgD family transcriptional regulator